MATTTRQSSLLVNQDWTKVYQAFTNADFTSYDFETLRNSMINYLTTYYPETFNDFLESSEYLALIDMVAFLGQSLSFRTDLNARENFIDTAQRRDSILKLARMLSYNPTRTTSASGILKFDSVTTTQTILDSNGINLSNTTINWNDPTNPNWLEQFTTILNSSLISGQAIGKPGNSQTINGILIDEYSIGIDPTIIPISPFSSIVHNTSTNFEAVSATTLGKNYIYERDPTISGQFNILYQNDNNGNGSNNTGFFLYFKQGSLQASNFSIQNAVPNNFVPITSNNINNTDAWLYSLDTNGNPQILWDQVPALAGINVIYNSFEEKNLYQINTENNDQITLVFGDGTFSNVPQGSFAFYYRTSNGLNYSITPDDISQVSINFAYIDVTGATQILTVTASLQYTVTNAKAAQNIADIKTYAPQQYYTQNRMITAEDYQIFPLTTYTSIQKIKAINRVSSGVSLYLDTLDTSGTFSSTNIFCDDGNIAATTSNASTTFSFLTTNDIYSAIYNDIIPAINSKEMVNYYYATYPAYSIITTANAIPWTSNATLTTIPIGTYISQNNNVYVTTGNVYAKNISWAANTVFTTGSNVFYSGNSYITTGNVYGYPFGNANVQANLSFLYSNNNSGFNTITSNVKLTSNVTFTQTANSTNRSWGNLSYVGNTTTIGNVSGVRANLQYIAPGASLQFNSNGNISYAVVTNVTNNTVYFGTVLPTNANLTSIIPPYKNDLTNNLVAVVATQIASKVNFGLNFDQINQIWVNVPPNQIGSTNNWMLKFTYNSGLYNIQYRQLTYSFSSAGETYFYFDPTATVYNSSLGTTISDVVKILKINSIAGGNSPLGQDIIWNIYGTVSESDGYVDPTQVLIAPPESQMVGVPDNPNLYSEVANNLGYRSGLYFQYSHNAPGNNRIDPTSVNLIDMYILTSDYTTEYFNWLQDLTGTVIEPTVPTSSSLEIAYSGLNDYKAISDTLIYNPAQFKPLFGAKSDPSVRARFQVVKNPAVSITDNEIKSQVINVINQYFNVQYWDFGDTFYFSELAAYLHTQLVPNIASILIVPADDTLVFGNYFQINSEPWEIITSSATVNDVDIISAVTAAQLNLGNTLVGTY